MKTAGSLLIHLIRELGIEDGVRLAEIKKNWFDLFHEPLSHHMAPCALSGVEILLHIDSPVWLQELNFYKDDIIKKLSPYGVQRVRFKLGRISTTIKAEGRRQKADSRQLTNEELSFIEETVSQIKDEELREAIRKAMQTSILTGKARNSSRNL